MYNLLIVDDEVEILDYLFDICREITKHELYVYRAESGEEALEVLRESRIDILLSDIRMPGMSGLELLDHARRETARCKFILLTGYRNFDTVYEAIQNGDVRYLLKTESEDAIQQVVVELLEELETELRNTDLLQKTGERLARLAPLLQREFVGALVGGGPQQEVTQQDLDENLLPLDAALPVLAFAGRIDRYGTSPAHRANCQALLQELPDRYAPTGLRVLVTQVDGFTLGLTQPQEDTPGDGGQTALRQVQRMLEYTQEAFLQLTGETASFAMGKQPFALDALASWAACLNHMLVDKIGSGKAMLVSGDLSILPQAGQGAARAGQSRMNYDRLREYMVNGQRDRFFRLLDLMLPPGGEREGALAFQEVYYSVAMVILGLVNQHRLEHRLADTIGGIDRLLRPEQHTGRQAAAQYLRSYAGELFDLIHSVEKSRAQRVMDTLKSYIEEHLQEDLTLARLSGLVHFNQSYLSRLFKQETGANLSEYILARRIEQAKRLLDNTDLKVGEVAQQVGYQSPHSFSRMFRHVTGVSPQDYRI